MRVKEWEQVIDEYVKPAVSRAMGANLEGDFLVLEVKSTRIVE